MTALDLPVYPVRARCICTHGLYAHQPRCTSGGCTCRRFEAAGGLVPLEVNRVPPFESHAAAGAASLLDA